MTTPPTLAEVLAQIGEPASAGGYRCMAANPVTGRWCGHEGMAGEFISVVGIPHFQHDFVCGHCYADLEMQARAIGRLMDKLTRVSTWDDEEGANIRGQRNVALQTWSWTIGEMSALTNKDEWRAYLEAWNTITVRYERPGLVEIPVVPEQRFD